ncbi:TetR/AcrR family transcriptional regulator [uncultured Tessaracoccus sp.]|uniref:TetR/AcrR family transcriptional regulator n=1 Tax=uncultured Tessaracoccus sp. TaxID=905023 RepID=UPI0025EA216D|nr:TetR/AcrR family transcriptional regulator [uncultured Tessaracoccus sp.]
MTETTPRREATRTKLVEAAVHEFAEQGIDATSVERLCETAGFTRGAFYSNFATKDDLCIAILEAHAERTLRSLQETLGPSTGRGAGIPWAVGEAMPTFFRTLGPTADFRRTMVEIRLRATRSPELAARLAAFEAEIFPSLTDALRRAADHAGLTFRLPPERMISVFDAVFFRPSPDGSVDQELMSALVVALMAPRD